MHRVFDYAAYIVTLGFRVLAWCHRGSFGFLDTVLEASCSTRDFVSLPDSPPAAPVASRVPEGQERRHEPEKPDPPQVRAWARAGCPLQLRLWFYRDSTSGSARGRGPGPGPTGRLRGRCTGKLSSAADSGSEAATELHWQVTN